MKPLPDHVVIVGLLASLGIVFALVFWFARLKPAVEPPLQWRHAPAAQHHPWQPGGPAGLSGGLPS